MKSELALLPTVFIASPYSKGDPVLNAHFQCKIFDQLLTEKRVLPVAPLWTHFQHIVYPRPYQDWIDYDQAMLRLYDCCLRLNAEINVNGLDYKECVSSGADAEVATFERLGKPVFYSIQELYQWVSARK
ncbi:hypothetical protein [Hydrogenophaga sp. IBVHS1]|uniref:hypothetical protein n=1 Tax=unclassified Hydrogenophaga TaxID=2610897 RepID=UPI000A2E5A54|nr:hypothetical protein [Hydrogenophaga sp. IBVHS1]OSZ74614.1 hypothetical protein CAP37_03895 [Hydrogenophaga sp. IBVHS1]